MELCATICLLAQPAPTCSHTTLFPKDKCKRMEKTYNISLRAKGGCSLYWQLCTWRDRQITRVPKCMWFPPFINGPRGSWKRRSFVHFHLDLPNHETSWPPCSQMYLNQAWLVNSSDKVETLKRHLAIPTPLTRISNANKQPWSVLCVAFAVCTVGYRLDVVLMVSAMGKPAPLASDPP